MYADYSLIEAMTAIFRRQDICYTKFFAKLIYHIASTKQNVIRCK